MTAEEVLEAEIALIDIISPTESFVVHVAALEAVSLKHLRASIGMDPALHIRRAAKDAAPGSGFGVQQGKAMRYLHNSSEINCDPSPLGRQRMASIAAARGKTLPL
jgi:hypothetical protein